MSQALQAPRRVHELHALTGARFAAALLVLFCHFGPLAYWPKALTAYGGAAVAFFFVLSGFILTYNYAGKAPYRSHAAYFNFVRARFTRIYPMFLVVFLATTALVFWSWKISPEAHPDGTAWQVLTGWLANLFLVQSYSINGGTTGGWCAPAWSVSCEATFYAMFPLILWNVERLRRTTTILLAAAGVWCFSLLSIVALQCLIHLLHRHQQAVDTVAYSAPYMRIGDFIGGCLAGMWFVRRGPDATSPRWARECGVWGGLAVAATIALCTAYGRIPAALGQASLLAPVFMVLILAMACGRTSIGNVCCTRPMQLLGHASYSLYLFHWLPWRVARFTLYPNFGTGWAIGLILLSIAGSVFLFHAVEDPCRRLLRGKPAGRPILAPAAPEIDVGLVTAMAG